jgi:hypothetical protein
MGTQYMDSAQNRYLNSGQNYLDPRAQQHLNNMEKKFLNYGDKYLQPNPYLDKMYGNAAGQVTRQFNESVLPGVSAKFGMSGRSGSGGMMNAVGTAYNELGQNLTGMAANLYGQDYTNSRNLAAQNYMNERNLYNQSYLAERGLTSQQNINDRNLASRDYLNERGLYEQNNAMERGLQQGMAQFAPQLLQSQAGLYQNALQTGQIRDDQKQRELNDQVARWQFDQERPYQNLRNYMGNISGNYGGSQQTASPAYSTPWYQYAAGAAGLLGGMMGP